MSTFKDLLWNEYPIPKDMSIWSDTGVSSAESDLNVLLDSCVRELRSDILVSDSLQAIGISTTMPEGTLSIRSCRMVYPFQGTRLVKYSFDKFSRQLNLRYFPSFVTYLRRLVLNDLETLEGDQLIYVKNYILAKMGEKELFMVKSIDMKIDNGSLDYSILEDSVKTWQSVVTTLKPEILLYSSQFN